MNYHTGPRCESQVTTGAVLVGWAAWALAAGFTVGLWAVVDPVKEWAVALVWASAMVYVAGSGPSLITAARLSPARPPFGHPLAFVLAWPVYVGRMTLDRLRGRLPGED